MFIPEYNAKIAEVMAQFHSLEMPFVKKPNWLFESTISYINQAHHIKFTNENDIIRFKKLQNYNLEQEFNELRYHNEKLKLCL